jgi:hypothetical protein
MVKKLCERQKLRIEIEKINDMQNRDDDGEVEAPMFVV